MEAFLCFSAPIESREIVRTLVLIKKIKIQRSEVAVQVTQMVSDRTVIKNLHIFIALNTRAC